MLRAFRRFDGRDHYPMSPALLAAVLARTPGDRLADGLAEQMTPKQRHCFARALSTVKFIGDDPPPQFFTVRDPDGLVGLFVDANPAGGFSAVTYPIGRLRDRVTVREPVPCIATAAAMIAGQLAHDLAASQRGGAEPEREVEVRHADDVALAARLVTPKHLARIDEMFARKLVPVLAIVGDTRAAFVRRPTFFVSVGALLDRVA